jgi:hypothetical protein
VTAPPPLKETWVIAVREALKGFRHVAVGQLVPGEGRWELVLTTLESPPEPALVDALREALGPLLGREDSPLAEGDDDGSTEASWHFYPPIGEREKELLARLDWPHAVVVHERID